MNAFIKVSIVPLFILFCIAYPIAVIGVVFNVHSPFSITWAASLLLILEGLLVTFAMMDMYGPPGLFAAVMVGLLAYGVEALGVNTGFPFGAYRYTDVLLFHLPGNVPLPVVFAWLMVVLSIYGMFNGLFMRRLGCVLRLILAPLCALLLDLLLEPVAFHLEHYWQWLNPGTLNYYGVPLLNFVAWFVVACILLYLVNTILRRAIPFLLVGSFSSRLSAVLPALIFSANVLMFGLIDLTHGYYLAVVCALIAAALIIYIRPFTRPINLKSFVAEAIK